MAKSKKPAAVAAQDNEQSTELATTDIVDNLVATFAVDTKVDSDTLVSVMLSRYERLVTEQIEEGRTACRELANEVKAAEKRLQERADAFAKNYKSEVVDKAREFYSAQGLKFQVDTEAKVTRDGVDIEFCFYSEKSRTQSYSSREVLHNEWKYSVVATDEAAGMADRRKELADLREQNTELQELLARWQQQLSKMGQIERHAKATVAEKLMQRSETGRGLLKSLDDQFGFLAVQKLPKIDSLRGAVLESK